MKYPHHLLLDLNTNSSQTLLYTSSEHKVKLLKRHTVVPTLNPSLESSTSVTLPTTTFIHSDTTNRYLYDKTILSVFDIHFLRKEKLYTKLKYSRCPQYDIVSGGFAAILAGFIGFLISEKFGIELVDSGDFYIAFMYGVFTAFFIRPFLLMYSKHETFYNPLSLKYLLIFIYDILTLLLILVKRVFTLK